jgi:hypothetical protein
MENEGFAVKSYDPIKKGLLRVIVWIYNKVNISLVML